jgi:hypothetical protein
VGHHHRRFEVKKLMLGISAVSLAAGMAGCASSNGFKNVAVTKDASAVASCQKVDDVNVTLSPTQNTFNDTSSTTVSRELANAARRKGANTVLITEDNGKNGAGTAYVCNMPSASATSGGSK